MDLQEANLLPKYSDLLMHRARVRHIIALPIKESQNTAVTQENIIESFRTLLIVTELRLTSFAITKTTAEDIPWKFIFKKIKEILSGITIKITVCLGTTTIPSPEQWAVIIQKKHESAIGGHKGISKTYHRVRQYYYWDRMKKDIQDYIRTCQKCQLKKLTRIKTK